MKLLPFALCLLLLGSCQSETKPAAESKPLVASEASLDGEALIQRGRYLVTIGGCNDCHSPKVMTPHGPEADTTKLLSGHPAGMPTPPIDPGALKPGGWMQMGPDITTFVGPWGITYAANLTSDSATGVGAWGEDVFIRALRTGKHMGVASGRPIMPPMPWQYVSQMTDQDLRAVYAYLNSLPPVSNRVPEPLTPQQAMQIK